MIQCAYSGFADVVSIIRRSGEIDRAVRIRVDFWGGAEQQAGQMVDGHLDRTGN